MKFRKKFLVILVIFSMFISVRCFAFSKNDIITYKSGKDFITHRVIEKTEDNLITKGDANTSKDSPITSNDVVGKVVYIFNNVGTWIKVLKTPQVLIAIIFSIITIRIIFGIKPKNKEVQ